MKGWLAQAFDGVFSFFGRIAIRRGKRAPNTLSSLVHYRGRAAEDLFPAPGELPDVTERARWRLGGLECRHLAFPSLHEPLAPEHRRRHLGEYQANNRVHVRWVRHADGAPRPTMILVHSWMQPDSLLEETTLLPMLAKRLGVHVARMQLPFHGRRRPESSLFDGEYFWTADMVRTFEAMRQSVLDARTLLSWIRERERGAPVGFAGMSLGGMVTLALACVDARPDFAMSAAAHLDLAGVLEDAPVLSRMRRELREYGWGPSEVDAYIAEVGMKELTPRIPTERILMMVGEHDRFLHADRAAALWRRWGEPPIHWFPGGHLGIFTHLRENTAAMRRHLERIGLVPPPAALART